MKGILLGPRQRQALCNPTPQHLFLSPHSPIRTCSLVFWFSLPKSGSGRQLEGQKQQWLHELPDFEISNTGLYPGSTIC